MSSELNASSWIRDYETTKAGVLNKRTLGTLISPEELRQFQAMVLSLERGLQTMQASPMAYEITISEISRRQVITENLKKMLPLLTVSGSPLVAGRQAAAAAGGGGSAVTDHIPAAGAGGVSRASEGGRSSMGILNPLQNINAVSDRGLAQRQEQVIKQQDAMIDDIERGVDRLHQRALEIGEESKFDLFPPPQLYSFLIPTELTLLLTLLLPLTPQQRKSTPRLSLAWTPT